MSERSETSDRWHGVDEELPPDEMPVWLWDGKRIFIGGRDYIAEAEGWLWWETRDVPWYDRDKWTADNGEDDDLHPTHWLELPMPPNYRGSA